MNVECVAAFVDKVGQCLVLFLTTGVESQVLRRGSCGIWF